MRRKTSIGIIAVAAAALIAGVVPTPAIAASPVNVRVMTWNIHGDTADIPAMAAFIQQEDPDILLVQEIQQSAARGNQVRDLESALGSEFTGKLHFGRADHPGEPCQSGSDYVGNAIYSKFAFLSHVTKELPRSATCPEASSVLRSLAGVNLDLGGGRNVVVWTTQLTPGTSSGAQAQRLDQAQYIEGYLDHTDPLILGGDFNDVPGTATQTTFTSNGWTDAGVSGGATHGTARIDYVFTKRAAVTGAFVPTPTGAAGTSDHRPVVVDLAIG